MSIQRMRRRFAVQLRIVLWVITVAFVIGLPLVFVPGRLGLGGNKGESAEMADKDIVANADGKPVMRGQMEREFQAVMNLLAPQFASIGQPIGLDQIWHFRHDGFEQAVQDVLLLERARDVGISVSAGELKQKAQELVDREVAQLKGRWDGDELERVMAQILAQEGAEKPRDRVSERQFRQARLDWYTSEESGLRENLVIERLQQRVSSDVTATEEQLREYYETSTMQHIVVTLHPPNGANRTKDEARKRAEQLLERIRSGADFTEVAKSESDDPRAEQNEGFIEGVRPGQRSEEWEEVAFALEPGEVSDVIEFPWGFEIIKNVGRESSLPDDFETNKDELLSNFAEQKRAEAWSKYVSDARREAAVEVLDPEMKAYEALLEKNDEDALSLLEEARTEARQLGGAAAASVFYQIAKMLSEAGDWEGAADAYAEVADALSSEEGAMIVGGRAEALLGMGLAYERLGEKEEAVLWYTAASEASEIRTLHMRARSAFERLGRQDLADREREWLDSYDEAMKQRESELQAQRESAQGQADSRASQNPETAPTGP